MSFGFPSRVLLAAFAALILDGLAEASTRELRVCADPNNLPFSNEQLQGFENRIVDLVAQELEASAGYTWWAQRRGFVRNTLKAGLCDLVPGTVSNTGMLRITAPYYRSSYVFVTRADGPPVSSLDDPVLRDLTIGVQLIGADGFNTPPAHALSRRGLVQNVRGFTVYGDYGEPNPPARIVQAVASREIDAAIVWGPLAGYFAQRQPTALRVQAVMPQADGELPMVFDISMGVRMDDDKLRREIDGALVRRHDEINAVLSSYHVPRLGLPQQSSSQ